MKKKAKSYQVNDDLRKREIKMHCAKWAKVKAERELLEKTSLGDLIH